MVLLLSFLWLRGQLLLLEVGHPLLLGGVDDGRRTFSPIIVELLLLVLFRGLRSEEGQKERVTVMMNGDSAERRADGKYTTYISIINIAVLQQSRCLKNIFVVNILNITAILLLLLCRLLIIKTNGRAVNIVLVIDAIILHF